MLHQKEEQICSHNDSDHVILSALSVEEIEKLLVMTQSDADKAEPEMEGQPL